MKDDSMPTKMDCRGARALLIDHVAERLDADARAAVTAHLGGCQDCRRAAAIETELADALQRLPRHRAPAALRRQLETRLAATPAGLLGEPSTTHPKLAPPPARRARARVWGWAAPFVSACAAAALVLITARATPPRPSASAGELVTEAVNDHLRVVASSRPVEIESGGIHQVKPWFTGKLDFAPRIAFSGDAEFPLVGGSIGYFRDRKAAVFLFKRRLHSITLLIFPAENLPWPAQTGTHLGRLSVSEETSRGFTVLLWRDQGLGYALVSDVNVHDLEQLAVEINGD